MNSVDAIKSREREREREEANSISSYEYESVHHRIKEKPESPKKERKEFSSRISFTIGQL